MRILPRKTVSDVIIKKISYTVVTVWCFDNKSFSYNAIKVEKNIQNNIFVALKDYNMYRTSKRKLSKGCLFSFLKGVWPRF